MRHEPSEGLNCPQALRREWLPKSLRKGSVPRHLPLNTNFLKVPLRHGPSEGLNCPQALKREWLPKSLRKGSVVRHKFLQKKKLYNEKKIIST